MTSHMTTPKGWYPDPSDPSRQRYFDGNKWTENYAPFGPPAPGIGQPAKTGMSRGMKIGLGIGAVVLVIFASCDGNSDKPSSSPSSSSSTATKTSSSTATKTRTAGGWGGTSSVPSTSVMPTGKVAAPVGSSVRDGKFEFEVLGVDRSASKEGVFSSEAAKGEFFIVHLRVTNIGDDARSFSASSQHLIVNGNKYDATTSITDENWMEDINPGLSIEASLTFDIPRGAVPESIEVHDSMFSGGALLAV